MIITFPFLIFQIFFELKLLSKIVHLLSDPNGNQNLMTIFYDLIVKGYAWNLLNLLTFLGCDLIFKELSQFVLINTPNDQLLQKQNSIEIYYFSSLFNYFSLTADNFDFNLAGPSLDILAKTYFFSNKFNILSASLADPNSGQACLYSSSKLRNYLRGRIFDRLNTISPKVTALCPICFENLKYRELRDFKLYGGTRLTCCGIPVHRSCIWDLLFDSVRTCPICRTELTRDPYIFFLGEPDWEFTDWGTSIDLMITRERLGIPRWHEIHLPNIKYADSRHKDKIDTLISDPKNKIRPSVLRN